MLQRLGANLDRVRQSVIQGLYGYPAGKFGEMPSPSPFEEREKVVLSLLIQEGLTASKIADVLGVSEEKVGEIIQAVIGKLKDI